MGKYFGKGDCGGEGVLVRDGWRWSFVAQYFTMNGKWLDCTLRIEKKGLKNSYPSGKNMRYLFLLLLSLGCQTKKRAMMIVCDAPKNCVDCAPEELGPYLAKRVRNPATIKMLKNLEDPQGIQGFISEYDLGIDECLLSVELEKLTAP